MNKILLIAISLFLQLICNAQTDIYIKVKQLIHEKQPEINLTEKLIGFVIWSAEDAESRNLNKSYEKTVHVYEHAKLKGGAKGLAVLSINKDDLSSEATIILQKDGILKLIPVKLEELKELDLSELQNAVFDSSGNEVYRNLSSSNVYTSINKLITR